MNTLNRGLTLGMATLTSACVTINDPNSMKIEFKSEGNFEALNPENAQWRSNPSLEQATQKTFDEVSEEIKNYHE